MKQAILAVLLCAVVNSVGAQQIAYNNSPDLEERLPSLAYAANSIAEFGSWIQLDTTNSFQLSSVTVGMMSWTLAANRAPYNFPITLNLYSVDNNGGSPEIGSLLATRTETFLVPEDISPTNRGTRFNLSYDFSDSIVLLPDNFVIAISFDAYPPHTPQVSLNVAVTNAAPVVGSNVSAASSWIRDRNGDLQAEDIGGYSMAVQVHTKLNAIPEPGSLLLSLVGLAVIATLPRLAKSRR